MVRKNMQANLHQTTEVSSDETASLLPKDDKQEHNRSGVGPKIPSIRKRLPIKTPARYSRESKSERVDIESSEETIKELAKRDQKHVFYIKILTILLKAIIVMIILLSGITGKGVKLISSIISSF